MLGTRQSVAAISIGVLIAIPGMVFSAGSPESTDETVARWQQEAQVGPYQPAEEDWDAIYEAAQNEPPLLVYGHTSRGIPSADLFMERFPGVEIEYLNIPSIESIERVAREWDAGRREVGVYMASLPGLQEERLVTNRGAVTRYVPREIEAVMDAHETEPLLRQRYGLLTWFFNAEEYDSLPFDNLWDLTTAEYAGRVALGDPIAWSPALDYFSALMSNDQEMRERYEARFGEPLDADNAGLEWLERVLNNDSRIVGSARDVSDSVEAANMFGFNVYSQYRDVLDGERNIGIDRDANLPAVVYWHYISMGTETRSPNAAKMFIRWLMSEEGGQWFWGPNIPVNPLVTVGDEWPIHHASDLPVVWETPPGEVAASQDTIIDYWELWR